MSLQLVRAQDAYEGDGPLLLPASVRYLGEATDAITEVAPHSLGGHLAEYGPLPSNHDGVLARLDELALTGRGGAHVPVATKWAAVRAASSAQRPAIVVANGAEGEPLSRKDAALIELRPHLILDGLAVAAAALGATESVIWLHERAHTARTSLTRALAERAAAHLHEPRPRIAHGPDHYLSGESSAIVHALSGGPALPRFRRARAAADGVDGRPTLIQNVETLARTSLIARGLDATASALLTIAHGSSKLVIEATSDAALGDVLRAGFGAGAPTAVLVGGYGGRWISWQRLQNVHAAEPELQALGYSLGAGVLMPITGAECGLERTAQIARYLADASAGHCGPCRFGLPAIAESMDAVVAGGWRSRHSRDRVEAFLAQVSGRGGCGHPDGAVQLVASALETFSDDLRAHRRGRCLHTAARRGRDVR